ncbi:DNA-binding IclR family transcriptional regulator [Paenarthrobacter nicotinovorans]|uniref:IclR family transcriptional regulator n=1 Tax=Paenarthrobacter nicotinovorans TaxID=29320 RepID=UPI00278445FC|nr:IclR family transcriptional regulator [Paenarthrobacter nicotinovorans]MDP9936818.1 DNA-binding IclR family transcriptional regulator [Paenarthrobacter nicotinovorans]
MATTTGGKGSLDRGLELFNYLAQSGEASTADLVQAMGMSRSAMYRLVERLQEDQYIVQNPAGQWRLGPSIARLAMAAVQSVEVMDVAPELLRALAQQTRESVSLGVLSGHEIVFVYRELGPQSVRVSAELGARRPLHATSIGKAYLAGLGERERSTILRQLDLHSYTPHTITSRARLEEDLSRSLERGWTEEHQEFDLSSTCCGAPIYDHTGQVVAAISVAGPAERMKLHTETIGPLASATAAAISRRLGFEPRKTTLAASTA